MAMSTVTYYKLEQVDMPRVVMMGLRPDCVRATQYHACNTTRPAPTPRVNSQRAISSYDLNTSSYYYYEPCLCLLVCWGYYTRSLVLRISFFHVVASHPSPQHDDGAHQQKSAMVALRQKRKTDWGAQKAPQTKINTLSCADRKPTSSLPQQP